MSTPLKDCALIGECETAARLSPSRELIAFSL